MKSRQNTALLPEFGHSDQRTLAKLCLVIVTVAVLSYVVNFMRVGTRGDQDWFQDDSEALVVGAMHARERDLVFDPPAHLGLVSYADEPVVDAGNRELTIPVQRTAALAQAAWRQSSRVEVLAVYPAPLAQSGSRAVILVASDGSTRHRVMQSIRIGGSAPRTIIGAEPDPSGTRLLVDGPLADATPGALATISPWPVGVRQVQSWSYRSQYGLHGQVLAWAYANLGLEYSMLRMAMAAASAVTVGLFAVSLAWSCGRVLGWSTGLVLALSWPGFVFAPNLYWAFPLWFLPAILTTLAIAWQGRPVARLAWVSLFAAFLLKNLCGYEFITTITTMCAIPVVAVHWHASWKRMLADLALVGAISVAAFLAALTIHAGMRTGDAIGGIHTILVEDGLRRTLGGSGESLANPLAVLKTYLVDWGVWHKPMLFDLSGIWFLPMLLLASVLVGADLARSTPGAMRTAVLFLLAMTAPATWFLLAPAHSRVHTHINFVLWYLTALPMLIAVVVLAVDRALQARYGCGRS